MVADWFIAKEAILNNWAEPLGMFLFQE